MIDPLGLLPPWVYGSFTMAVLWNSAVNILVYIYYNRGFREHVLQCSAYARLEQLLVAQNHKIQLVPQQKVKLNYQKVKKEIEIERLYMYI